MKIIPNWWKSFFNEIYLITDARSICNPTLTFHEVDLIEKTLGLNKKDRILDLCGGYGRHCLEFAKRGYLDLTVLDYSDFQIKHGKAAAKKQSLKVKFIRADARANNLKSNYYDAVIIMANSFGYFVKEKENYKILKESGRLLKKGGKLLLDLADPDYIKNNLKPFNWHIANKDIIVLRKREINRNILKAREIVISRNQGILRDGFYYEMVYTKKKIIELIKKAGFINISFKNNLSLHNRKTGYGLLTCRMFISAIKS